MITPALIAAECERSTYTAVARRYGLTKGKVAGLVYKHRHPPIPVVRAPRLRSESPVELAVLMAMADGRMRTPYDLVRQTGYSHSAVCKHLRRLAEAGVLSLIEKPPQGSTRPSIWQEAPE